MSEKTKKGIFYILYPFIGKKIKRIEQVFYVFKDEIDKSDCFLQFVTENNEKFHFTGVGNGESFVVKSEGWIDDFEEPLDEGNRKYIAKHGKWTLFNFSNESLFNKLIGEPFNDFCPLLDERDKPRGVRLQIGENYLCYMVNYDEGFIVWGKGYEELFKL